MMEARRPATADEEDQLVALVARIRAQGGKALPRPASGDVARFLARTAQEVPLSDHELEEHERLWRTVDEEVRALEQSNDVVGGLA